MTTQKQIRDAFWQTHEDAPGISRAQIRDHESIGTMYNTTTRCAFVDYVDALQKGGEISEALANWVTP